MIGNRKKISPYLVLNFALFLALAFSGCSQTEIGANNAIKPETTVTPSTKTSNSRENKPDEQTYLLIFKAYPPHEKRERNFYELGHITGFFDRDVFPPSGTVTDQLIRYGVFAVMKTKILKSTDSRQSPKSPKDGAYVLAYDRIYKICAKSYSLKGGKSTYVDYENGRRYEFPIKTTKPFPIYELEVTAGNVFREVWEEKNKGQ